jgi:diketogulonate reductase-like aldo/keto reductase
MPNLIYGTAWKEERTQQCVEAALALGFRALDTANQRKHYFEEAVGAALLSAYEDGHVTRQDLFLQTKFTSIGGQDHRLPYDPSAAAHIQVQQSFASSLAHLHTDYLDSYVLHGPSGTRGLTEFDWQVWVAMGELYKAGSVRALGVSNMQLEQLRLLFETSEVKPTYLQNRCYARTGWDKEIRGYCRKHDILYQGFSLLTANQAVLENARFCQLVKKYACTPAQMIFGFSSQVGMLPLTGTTNPEHMREDLLFTQCKLEDQDVTIIENIMT